MKKKTEANHIIELANGKTLSVYNLYNPPGTKLNMVQLCAIAKLPNSLIVGDFNAHHSEWGSNHDDANGVGLLLNKLTEEK